MRHLALSFLAVVFVTCFSVHSFADSPLQNSDSGFSYVSTSVTSPDHQLDQALLLAKQGDYKRGIELARQTLDSYPDDVRTKLAFIESMVKMEKLPNEDHDVKILNYAIRVANDLNGISQCDGSQDPELGFCYLKALGELAYAVEPKQRKVSAQLKHAIGTVAENLHQNPLVSPDAHKYLAAPYYDKARAHAARGETELTAVALQQAFELGFVDFERATNEEVFMKLENADDIREIIGNNKGSIVEQEIEWARKSVAQFQRFPFVIQVDGLEQGTISNADFDDKKLLVVDLWATWCPPCVKAIPHFIELQKEFRDQNVAVFGIAMDDVDNPVGAREVVKAAVEQHKFNYECGLGDQSVVNQIAGQMALPTTLFIDSAGTVRYKAEGYLKYSQLQALTNVLLEQEPK